MRIEANTAAHPGPLDPTAKCDPDEPIFPLVGHDPDAPPTIRFWSDTRRKRILSILAEPGDIRDDEIAALRSDLARCTAADALADTFDDWRLGRNADEAPLERATYNGPKIDDSERLSAHKAMQHLAEAVFHAAEAMAIMGQLGDPDEAIVALAHEALRNLHLGKIETRAAFEAGQ